MYKVVSAGAGTEDCSVLRLDCDVELTGFAVSQCDPPSAGVLVPGGDEFGVTRGIAVDPHACNKNVSVLVSLGVGILSSQGERLTVVGHGVSEHDSGVGGGDEAGEDGHDGGGCEMHVGC